MADKKISQLSVAASLTGSESVALVQSGATLQASVNQIQQTPISALTANALMYLNGLKVPTASAGLSFDGTNLGVGTPNVGTSGLSLSQNFNLSWEQSATESIATMFRQASSAAFVLASGYKRSATANGFASSYSTSWAKTAISLGTVSGAISFYADAAAAVAVGTDVTPTERMRVGSTGATIYAPTSGTTLALTALSAGISLTATDGTRAFSLAHSGGAVQFGSSSAHDINLISNNTTRIVANAAGNVTINAPASGDALTAAGGVVVSAATGGLGYTTGAGGTVTQATSKTTTVTLNKPAGAITLNNASLAAGATAVFQLNNSLLTSNDMLALSFNNGATWAGIASYSARASVSAGLALIAITNESAGALAESPIINFAIIKGATA